MKKVRPHTEQWFTLDKLNMPYVPGVEVSRVVRELWKLRSAMRASVTIRERL